MAGGKSNGKENGKGNGSNKFRNGTNKPPPPDLHLFPHMKHISEISPEDQREAKELLKEITDIFEGILLLSPQNISNHLSDLRRLKKEVEKLGYGFTSEIKTSSSQGKLTIKADLRLYTSKCKTKQVN